MDVQFKMVDNTPGLTVRTKSDGLQLLPEQEPD